MNIAQEYYTPSIDDLRVGYECEEPILDFSCFGGGCPKQWKKVIIGENYNENDLREMKTLKFPVARFLRTPYLTKEQIEKEGWEINKFKTDNNYIYCKKGMSEMRYDMSHTTLAIWNWIDKQNDTFKFPAFYGNCSSINEFRTIIKWLGI